MKKPVAALLALLLLLPCLPALAESAPKVFEETGINLDFGNVLDASTNYMDLWELGVVSREPFVAALNLQYYALDREFLTMIAEKFDELSEDQQESVRQMQTDIATSLAQVIVTDIQDANTLVGMLRGELPEGADIKEFGQVEPYHYYVVNMPGFQEPEDYQPAEEGDPTPEEVHEAYVALGEDIAAVRAAFLECQDKAELYVPVDLQAKMPGKVLSFETTDLDGNTVTSADLFKENKITMVNVWGSWCHNCVGEMTELAEIHTRLLEKGCGVVGVEWEQEPITTLKDDIRALLEEKGTNYPNVIMPQDNEIFDQIKGFPTTFFVDSEGTILCYPISGALEDQYESTVDQLLAGEPTDTAADGGAVKNEGGEYRVIVYDMEGNPVEGALIQLCDDVTCAFQPTDADGVATFCVEEQKVYDVHVLMAPDGFVADQGEHKTLDTYSDVNIFLEKAE